MRPAAAFVGRGRELGALAEELQRARAGEPRLIWVTGEPGIGKTSLLRRMAESAAGATVLWASGDEAESGLAYGVVEQLRAGLPEELAPAPSYRRADGSPADPLQVGAELLADVGALQTAGPVVAVVDDAHWVDEPSARALVFLLRRLRRDQVVVALGVRPGLDAAASALWDRALADERLVRRLSLGGLEPGDLVQLASVVSGLRLPASAARRLHEHTGGHPLHARALLEESPPAALTDRTSALPAPRSLSALVLDRLSRLSPAARELVVCAAVLGTRAALSDVVSMAGLPEPAAALDEVVTAGVLVESRDGAIRQLVFPNRLVQTAVHDDLTPGRRAGLHRRAADLLGSGSAALSHRAAAAVGPDAELATEFVDLAQRELASGNWQLAVSHLGVAADLSPTPELRAACVVRAAEGMLAGGDIAGALHAAPALQAAPPSATRSRVLGQLAVFTGRFAEAREHFAHSRALGSHGGDQGTVDTHLSMISLIEGETGTAVELGAAALHAGPPSATADLTHFVYVLGLAAEGRHTDSAAAIDALEPTAGNSVGEGSGPPSVERLALRGFLALWSDRPAEAAAALSEVVRRAGSETRLQSRVLVLGHLAEAQYRTGSWDEAAVNAELAMSLAEDAGIHLAAGHARAVAAYVASGRGHPEEAQRLVAGAAEAAVARPWWAARAYAASAAATAAQAAGDHTAMLAALETFDEPSVLTPVDALGALAWRALRTEALLGLGALDRAEAELADLESRTATRVDGWSALEAARLRAELTELEQADHDPAVVRAAYERAMTVASRAGGALSIARSETSYGRFLLALGERRPAADLLRTARERLERLRAQPFLATCDSLLKAAGLPPPRVGNRLALTTQELAVARAVAAGRTNQEVGAELFVTSRTVAYHLSNIYAKTGLTSRRELARRLPTLLA